MTPEKDLTPKKDQNLSPEKLRRRPIVSPPLIVLKPDNETFALDGWKTPDGVNLNSLENPITSEGFKPFIRIYCEERGFNFGDVNVSKGVLESLEIQQATGMGRVCLSGIDAHGQGDYQFENVTEGRVAVGLQALLAIYVNGLQKNYRLEYPYLNTSGRDQISFFPVDLRIPRHLCRSTDQLTGDCYQADFIEKAGRMAQRFNLHLREMYFSQSGLLTKVSLRGGDACHYSLDESRGEYGEHNVDFSHQAILLHWICGTFIRDLKRIVEGDE
ncbi:MAG TPA: hypothetical protein VMX76_01060 [Nevskiaceae bacterium]|nr:hypothetical protein [Nevskiaceae bacterium]